MRSARRHTMVAMVVASVALTAACGGGTAEEPETAPDDGAAEAPAAAEGGGAVLSAGGGGPARNERTQAVIDLYEAANPGVTVNGTTAEFTSHWENMTVQAAGGNLPCIPQMQNRTMADYGDRGALRALDDLVESGAIDVTNIPESVLDSGRGADGNLYMIPYGAAFGSMMVNETTISELGLELPPEGYDWDWLQEWLLEISEATGQPAMGNVGQHTDLFEAWVRSHGEELYTEEGIGFTAGTVQAYWEWVAELADAGAIDSPERGVETRGQPVEQSDFAQGTRAAHIWPANALGTVQGAIDQVEPGNVLAVYPLPSGPDGPGNALWLSGLAIAENCDNVDTAASFIDFFVNDGEAALAYASDNGANTNTENLQLLLDSPDISDAKKSELELYRTLTDLGVGRTIYGKGFAAIFQQGFTRFYEQLSLQGQDLGEAAEQFLSEAENTIG